MRSKVKTRVVKGYNEYFVYLESKDRIGDGGGFHTTSAPFKSFKNRTSASRCKIKLDRVSNPKKWAWLNLADKPIIKC